MNSFISQQQLPQAAQQALAAIIGHIKKRNPDYSKWYAGIATDPRQRLFSDHGVSEHSGTWMHSPAGSEDGARAVEKRLLSMGCKGGPGGGDAPKHVYAYLITNNTRE